MAGRVENKIVIVSGAARGIGAAHAQALVDEGAAVVLTDLRTELGEAHAEALGDRAIFVRADVTNPDDWADAVRAARSRFGEPNGLINNAGILESGTVETTTVESFQRLTNVLQLGVMLGMQAVIPSMRLRGGGSIVNMSSTAGIIGFKDYFAYGASKFAVRGMTKVAALELAGDGIRVNSIHPGDTVTPMIEGLSEDFPADEIPFGRYGRPHEIAALAVYLISDESSYTTGAEHVIDGGYTAV